MKQKKFLATVNVVMELETSDAAMAKVLAMIHLKDAKMNLGRVVEAKVTKVQPA
jgi:hypothetical protein